MKAIIVLFAFCALAVATPIYPTYHVGIPLGPDGKVLDTPEVAQAKAAHLATQAYEAARNTLGYGYAPALYAPAVYAPAITYGAPVGTDGRVVDTPEVAQAKAAHLAAHAQEAAKTIGLVPYGALAYATSPAFYAYSYAPLGPDGRVIDTPEVAQAKAAHLAAHAQAAARNAH
ncbi:cuticle protein 18.7-like [Pogonomyrmex barbatus]|uniref:Cuticle protein 18.7-like n=1 Tax=Pogonomyrmex barbatus TaxID=144034 RepID=A0A6I9WYF8_9HYME|nr:cuticle protein 18.7-like [Pogonomyrmex barbatus]